MKYLVAVALAFSYLHSANADDSCVIYGINQSGIKENCRAKTSSNAGDSRPNASDSLVSNPASLPIKSTPWGVEAIGSSEANKVNLYYASFGIIRGFKNFGVGFGADTDGTFYSNRASAPVEHTFPSIPSFNLGLASAIPFFDSESSILVPIIGGAFKYNPDSAKQGYSGGLNFAGNHVSFGGSYQREPSDILVPDQTSWNFNLSGEAGPMAADFTYGILNYVTSEGVAEEKKSYILTVTAHAYFITALAAMRIVDGQSSPTTRTQMYGLIFQIFSRFRVGYFYDYRPHSHSIGMQALIF